MKIESRIVKNLRSQRSAVMTKTDAFGDVGSLLDRSLSCAINDVQKVGVRLECRALKNQSAVFLGERAKEEPCFA